MSRSNGLASRVISWVAAKASSAGSSTSPLIITNRRREVRPVADDGLVDLDPGHADHLVIAQDGRGVAVPGELHRLRAAGGDHRLVPEGGQGLLEEERGRSHRRPGRGRVRRVRTRRGAALTLRPPGSAAAVRGGRGGRAAAGRLRDRRRVGALLRGGPDRQVERERGASSPRRWRKPQVAAMRSHDRLRDRQAEAGALAGRLGGEERLEQPVHVLGCDAAARRP